MNEMLRALVAERYICSKVHITKGTAFSCLPHPPRPMFSNFIPKSWTLDLANNEIIHKIWAAFRGFQSIPVCFRLYDFCRCHYLAFSWRYEFGKIFSYSGTSRCPFLFTNNPNPCDAFPQQLQLTRIGVSVPPGGEAQTIVIPILYDTSNITQMAEQRSAGAPPPTQSSIAVSNMLKRFSDFNSQSSECSILPAVRELMTNLVIPM